MRKNSPVFTCCMQKYPFLFKKEKKQSGKKCSKANNIFANKKRLHSISQDVPCLEQSSATGLLSESSLNTSAVMFRITKHTTGKKAHHDD